MQRGKILRRHGKFGVRNSECGIGIDRTLSSRRSSIHRLRRFSQIGIWYLPNRNLRKSAKSVDNRQIASTSLESTENVRTNQRAYARRSPGRSGDRPLRLDPRNGYAAQFSKIVATPCPWPTQSEAMPYLAPASRMR